MAVLVGASMAVILSVLVEGYRAGFSSAGWYVIPGLIHDPFGVKSFA